MPLSAYIPHPISHGLGDSAHTSSGGVTPAKTIGNDPVGNLHAVVWASLASPNYDGLFLPSLRRFSVVIASAVNNVTQMALSSKSLYVLKQDSELLATVAPTPPRSPRKK